MRRADRDARHAGDRRRRAAQRRLDRAHRRGRALQARRRARAARPTTVRPAPDCACTRSSTTSSTATRSSSATAATSSPTPAASSTPTSRAAGWTPARTGAWAQGRATRSRPSSPTPTARSSCCWATARSASRGWSSTRWRGTASTSSASWATTASGPSRSTRWMFLYGYSVAAELRPETRYDQVVEALGGHGELVRTPGELRARARTGAVGGQAGARQRAHRPFGRVPALVQPGLAVSRCRPAAGVTPTSR